MNQKVGRNQPCTCGSGKKYKKCCGNVANDKIGKFTDLPKSVQDGINKLMEKHKAQNLAREKQQGLGKPIIETKFKNHQIVAVGNKLFFSKNWKTFADFLSDYIKNIIGEDWGNNELKKSFDERHPIVQWYHDYCLYQKKNFKGNGGIHKSTVTGIVVCYLGLAYNLYLLQHNIELQKRMVDRLKHLDQFQGAYYELIVMNCLIREGFDLFLEDETDRSSKHCEFYAICKQSKQRYSVEVKIRSASGFLGYKKPDGKNFNDPTSQLIPHLNKALKKPAKNSKRLIFIDLNSELESPKSEVEPNWVKLSAKKLEDREKSLEKDQEAYVFITNMAFHRNLDKNISGVIFPYGLGIKDFNRSGEYSLIDIYKSEQKHIDVYNISNSMASYPNIPKTFDGSLPSYSYNKNLEQIIIGEKYFFEDVGENGVIGEVMSATVSENEKSMILSIFTDDKKSLILRKAITDEELDDYKNYPEGFFGSMRQTRANKIEDDNPYELFKWFHKTYKNSSREKLLDFMKNRPDLDKLKKLSQEELALQYCDALVYNLLKNKK
jgi:hypothetical protein